jgi:hypothetical protein
MKLRRRTQAFALYGVLLALSMIAGVGAPSFWSTQRKGANFSNSRPTEAWFQAAHELGLQFIRMSPDLWPAEERDFLIGNADNFVRVNAADLAVLKDTLDTAHKYKLKVVLVMFNLPGCRWKQLNGDRDDGRIWRDESYQEQALEFWKQLALELKGHPAVVAYNPLNEPHPDREFGWEESDLNGFSDWLEQIRGTAADLNRFNRRIVEAIRLVDPETPIILDGWFYSAPVGFRFLEPVKDANTLYALHNPAPWEFAAFRVNKGRFSYPDRMPNPDGPEVRKWSVRDLERQIEPVEVFAREYGIVRDRIIASEFWCDRRVPGAAEYFSDLIGIYQTRKWHWAFYAFRGDDAWGGLDYELGTGPLGGKYWEATEQGVDPETLKQRHDNPLWSVLRREFQGQ